MADKTVAVWDIGKTNTKIALASYATGEVLTVRSETFPSLSGPPYIHLDAESHWNWFKKTLAEFSNNFDIDAIVVTAHGACSVLVDDEQRVLPILDYEDSAPEQCENEYAKLRPAFAESLSPPLPGSLNYGRGLFWQSRQFASEFAQAKYILSYVQYWSWRMCGIAATECTTIGCHSDLWNPKQKKFSSLVDKLDWHKLFPPMRRADEVLGTVKTELAEEIGISPQTKVLCGIHDSNASLLAWLDRDQPFTVSSTGTWVINFGVGASLEKMDPNRDCVANVSMYGDTIACSRWMGGREHANITNAVETTATLDDLEKVMGDERMMILPNQGGKGGPFCHLPVQQNQHLDELSPVEREAVASLYCALMLDVTFDLIVSNNDIIVEGSFARNKLLTQILATLRPKQNILISKDITGTTAGALRLVVQSLPLPRTQQVCALAKSNRLLSYRDKWKKNLNNN